MRNGKSAEAEPLFRRLIEIKPEFPSYIALAVVPGARSRPRRRERGRCSSRRSARPSPTSSPRPIGRWRRFYYSRGRFDDAEKTLREAIEKTPDDLETIYALARFYVARGDEAKADLMVKQATEARPDDEKTWLVLSAFRGRKGDLPGALAAAEDAIKRNPESRTAKLRKAELLLDMGYREGSKEKIAEGRSITDAVLATEPGNADALFVKSKIDLAENRTDDAVTALRRALEAKPDWAQAHFLLGSALLLQNDLNGARSEAARAVELEPDLMDAHEAPGADPCRPRLLRPRGRGGAQVRGGPSRRSPTPGCSWRRRWFASASRRKRWRSSRRSPRQNRNAEIFYAHGAREPRARQAGAVARRAREGRTRCGRTIPKCCSRSCSSTASKAAWTSRRSASPRP